MTESEIFKKAEQYKVIIKQHEKNGNTESELWQNRFKIKSAYNSYRQEENTLTQEEIRILLDFGIMPGGKPSGDCLKILGYSNACGCMFASAEKKDLPLTEELLQTFHRLLCEKIDGQNAGVYRQPDAAVAFYPPAREIPHLMEHFISQIQSSQPLLPPIEFAALCGKRLIDIQPFACGNEITANLFMNFILVSQGFCPVTIAPENRKSYMRALAKAQKPYGPELEPFIQFIAGCVIQSEQDYCRFYNIKLKE